MKMNKKNMMMTAAMMAAAGMTAVGICMYEKMKKTKLDVNNLCCYEKD